MSGDLGAEVVVRAAAATLDRYANVDLLLVGDRSELKDLVTRIVGDNDRLKIVHASEVVEMSEPPADALRKKKDSSMRVAINLVKEGAAHACVSSGNTGALMATSKFVLKTLPGIGRPAFITELPAKSGSPSFHNEMCVCMPEPLSPNIGLGINVTDLPCLAATFLMMYLYNNRLSAD